MSYFVYEFILKMQNFELTASTECEYNKQTRMCFDMGCIDQSGNKMKKSKRNAIVPILWIFFAVTAAGIAFLSFQNGEEAKKLGEQFILYLAQKINHKQNVSAAELSTLTYDIRQGGRALVFLFLGIIGTTAVHLSCPKWNWTIKTVFTAGMLLIIAFLTEKLKIFIPSRHYSYEEMLISITAVIAGFLVVSLITLTVSALKGFFRLMAASHLL